MSLNYLIVGPDSSGVPCVNAHKVHRRFGVYPSSRNLEVDANISSEEVLVEILDRQVNKFRNKEISFINVLLKNHLVGNVTWEA